MPLAWPSHPGLIAPLWRRWPEHFNVLACCVGAAVPDVVDGAIGFARGNLGQGIGHSLIGLFLLCLPAGVLLLEAIKRFAPRRTRGTIDRWAAIPSNHPRRVELVSIWVGAFSHLFFDFISHEGFLWLYPWYQNDAFFPAWWYVRWFEVPLPFYEQPYPIGPHWVVWLALSVIGAWMLARRA